MNRIVSSEERLLIDALDNSPDCKNSVVTNSIFVDYLGIADAGIVGNTSTLGIERDLRELSDMKGILGIKKYSICPYEIMYAQDAALLDLSIRRLI